MVKLYTEIQIPKADFGISLSSRTVVLGSCFADGVGQKMKDAGFDVLVNPFGTLYNPLSIAAAIERLESGNPFGPEDCVEMGAGAGKICSFSHHTKFARATAEEFLRDANAALAEASAFWKTCDTVIITLGTAWVWRLAAAGNPGTGAQGMGAGVPVANCLKRNAAEFTHEMMSVGEASAALSGILDAFPEKRFVLTVSPIRHLWNGVHSNQLSKATLLLACESLCGGSGVGTCDGSAGARVYFPSYEILLDELRDYRYYADDLCHPSATAVKVVWERFVETFVPESEFERLRENERAARRAAHREIL